MGIIDLILIFLCYKIMVLWYKNEYINLFGVGKVCLYLNGDTLLLK